MNDSKYIYARMDLVHPLSEKCILHSYFANLYNHIMFYEHVCIHMCQRESLCIYIYIYIYIYIQTLSV